MMYVFVGLHIKFGLNLGHGVQADLYVGKILRMGGCHEV